MNDDLKIRRAALTRLAIATRERLPESQEDRNALFRVYLDDLDRFSTDTFLRACRRLETMTWFPKKGELAEACQAVAKYKADNAKPRLALGDGDTPVDPAKWGEFKLKVYALIKRKMLP